MATAATVAKRHNLFMISSPFPASLVGRGGFEVQNWPKRILRRDLSVRSMGRPKGIERPGGRLRRGKKAPPGGGLPPGGSLPGAIATGLRADPGRRKRESTADLRRKPPPLKILRCDNF